ncbi:MULTISPECIES: 3-oxoacid CoA-transferase subunit B [Burkholderia]|uniref:Succinyl-CoA--3-ketoacid-CoA transferase n=1 Tax=Burkholderia aenigmatica TaxID=2015348 RepID=A0ABY6XLR7_9BURK|nr:MULTISPECIES: 3-oxoacid CoA-transferase subunit B [Burkholderia]VWC54636.1 succinyl-CoA--3-ketoacid-CoA transferase [Burkholderia aenigmatica]VWC67569.1 succinyl-CoA--3-ketoacid-CoA transferase [Burkholderia aenigmatica]
MNTSPSSADPRHVIARRAAREVARGQLINLGIGLPTLIPSYLGDPPAAWIHSENGIVGVGALACAADLDRELIDAGGGYVSVVPGGAIVDSAESFGMIRRGLVDITFLGALQVSAHGDLANWLVPGGLVAGIGGGAELAQKARRVIVTMPHTDKNGRPKIVEQCTLPLTARRRVAMVITEHAVFRCDADGLTLVERLGAMSVADLRDLTDADFTVAREAA